MWARGINEVDHPYQKGLTFRPWKVALERWAFDHTCTKLCGKSPSSFFCTTRLNTTFSEISLSFWHMKNLCSSFRWFYRHCNKVALFKFCFSLFCAPHLLSSYLMFAQGTIRGRYSNTKRNCRQLSRVTGPYNIWCLLLRCKILKYYQIFDRKYILFPFHSNYWRKINRTKINKTSTTDDMLCFDFSAHGIKIQLFCHN